MPSVSQPQFGSIAWYRQHKPGLPGPYYHARLDADGGHIDKAEFLHIDPLIHPVQSQVSVPTERLQKSMYGGNEPWMQTGNVDHDVMTFVFKSDKSRYRPSTPPKTGDMDALGAIIDRAEFLIGGDEGARTQEGVDKLFKIKQALRQGHEAGMIVYVSGQFGKEQFDQVDMGNLSGWDDWAGKSWNPRWDNGLTLKSMDKLGQGHQAGFYLIKGEDVQALVGMLKPHMRTWREFNLDASTTQESNYSAALQPGVHYQPQRSPLVSTPVSVIRRAWNALFRTN